MSQILVTHTKNLLAVRPKTGLGKRKRKKKHNGNCKAFCVARKRDKIYEL